MRLNLTNQRLLMPTVGVIFLIFLAQACLLSAQAQPTPEAAIDLFLRSNASLPKGDAKAQQLYTGMRTWLGSYQGIRKEGKDYIATFQNASLPVVVRLNAKGNITSFWMGCPLSGSLSLNQAPAEVRQPFSKCSNLKK
jgi:hypothetical protein